MEHAAKQQCVGDAGHFLQDTSQLDALFWCLCRAWAAGTGYGSGHRTSKGDVWDARQGEAMQVRTDGCFSMRFSNKYLWTVQRTVESIGPWGGKHPLLDLLTQSSRNL